MRDVFVIEDEKAAERNSYGCFIVAKQGSDSPAFYCDEWMWLWTQIEDIGKSERAETSSMPQLQPMDHAAILANGLGDRVDRVLTFPDDSFVRALKSVSYADYVRDRSESF